MLTRISFDYAVLRIVPRVERGEFINAGIVLFCLSRRFLEARVYLNEGKLQALSPDVDLSIVKSHLDAFPKICRGDVDAGPIARLSQRERFHWLVAPRSTIIQVSPVHSGLCETPQLAIKKLFEQMVLP